MGIIINKTAITVSLLTTACLYFKLEPIYAFILGAIVFSAPIRLLLPGRDKKIISETGIISSLGVIVAFTTVKLDLLFSFAFGVIIGYFYLIWWIIILPRILK